MINSFWRAIIIYIYIFDITFHWVFSVDYFCKIGHRVIVLCTYVYHDVYCEALC